MKVESQEISMCETFILLKELNLVERKNEGFLPIVIRKVILALERSENIQAKKCTYAVYTLYQTCIDYLNNRDMCFIKIEVFEWVTYAKFLCGRRWKKAKFLFEITNP